MLNINFRIFFLNIPNSLPVCCWYPSELHLKGDCNKYHDIAVYGDLDITIHKIDFKSAPLRKNSGTFCMKTSTIC